MPIGLAAGRRAAEPGASSAVEDEPQHFFAAQHNMNTFSHAMPIQMCSMSVHSDGNLNEEFGL
jgi:hypothetical protein